MRSVYLGTPAAAVPALAALLDVDDVALVVTQPDRARGRSSRPVPPPVKLAAQEWGLPIAQPADAAALDAAVRSVPDLDVGVVVAYGRILRPEVLAATRVGYVNIHFSLLPRWRGAAPVERSLLAGDEMTGVSLMHLDEGLDTGPIISVIETPIADDETGGTLTARLSHLGAVLLSDTLPGFMAGSLQPAAQISAGATYAARLRPEEAQLDHGKAATALERLVRAFNPRPSAWLTVDGDRLKVLASSVVSSGPAAGIIEGVDGHPVLGTADGGLRLDVVQPAGKGAQPGTAWLNGRRGAPAAAGG
jgi:methionyl-tRNA formyltransferase